MPIPSSLRLFHSINGARRFQTRKTRTDINQARSTTQGSIDHQRYCAAHGIRTCRLIHLTEIGDMALIAPLSDLQNEDSFPQGLIKAVLAAP